MCSVQYHKSKRKNSFIFSSIYYRSYKKSKPQPMIVPLIKSEVHLDIPDVVSFYFSFSTCSGGSICIVGQRDLEFFASFVEQKI